MGRAGGEHDPMRTSYNPNPRRYEQMTYRRVGRSGLLLPAISLGMWHNFGDDDDQRTAQRMCFEAFDLGITHFDLANNYGPPPGSAEKNAADILKHLPRHELVISTKAGYRMWPGPYGEWGSRKYLLTSLDQSLRRLQMDYVDIFYSHRPDPQTPLAETLGALDQAVRSGKALYAGISSYSAEMTREAVDLCQSMGMTRITIHQPSYSLFDRWVEMGLVDAADELGIGLIAFCPLAQGLLTDKYLRGIPSDSRAASRTGFLRPTDVTPQRVQKAAALARIAAERGQTLAQMALAWVLRQPCVSSALIGASRAEQIRENVAALANISFTQEQLRQIEQAMTQP